MVMALRAQAVQASCDHGGTGHGRAWQDMPRGPSGGGCSEHSHGNTSIPIVLAAGPYLFCTGILRVKCYAS